MAGFDNVLYHHIDVNDDRGECSPVPSGSSISIARRTIPRSRLEAWLTCGSPRDCVDHIRPFAACGWRITFGISITSDLS